MTVSGFHADISAADFSNLQGQIADGLQFVEQNHDELVRLVNFPGVECVSVDFGIEERDVPAQSERFAPNLLRMLGNSWHLSGIYTVSLPGTIRARGHITRRDCTLAFAAPNHVHAQRKSVRNYSSQELRCYIRIPSFEKLTQLHIDIEKEDMDKGEIVARCLTVPMKTIFWRCWSDRLVCEIKRLGVNDTQVRVFTVPNLFRMKIGEK